jgi:CheY-like chemotaxis protein
VRHDTIHEHANTIALQATGKKQEEGSVVEGVAMKRKVLIVDDEPEQIDFAATLLEENGYIPVGASNGIEGMKKAKTEKPDLILLDILMPERGGIGMYQDLKHDEETRNIPVVVVTGVAKGEDSDQLMIGQNQNLPAPDAYIEKPINPDVVISLIRDLLS